MIKNKYNFYIIILIVIGFLIRFLMISIDPFLHNWDEHFHALVAKNLSKDFTLPILLNHPLEGYRIEAWCDNHIWLHKQPLFLWQIAIANKFFSTSIFSVRLPSLIMTTLSLLIIYRVTFLATKDRKISLIALFLATFSNYQLNLISGRIATDQNDIAFGFYILLSIWSLLEYYNSKKFYWIILIGLFAGCAVLVKWLVGLLVFSSWGIIALYYIFKNKNYSFFILLVISFLICISIFLPWQIFAFYKFPLEYLFESSFNKKHIFEIVEGHDGSFIFYIKNFVHYFGFIISLFVFLGIWISYKKNDFKTEIGFSLIFYFLLLIGFFTFIVSTRMISFIYPILPIGIVYASIGIHLFIQKFIKKQIFLIPLFILLLLDALNPYDIWKKTYRSHEYTKKSYNTKILKSCDIKVPEDYNIIINLSDYENIDLMFFNKRPFAAYQGVFTQIELSKYEKKKIKIAAFADHGKYILPDYIKKYPFIYIINDKLMD